MSNPLRYWVYGGIFSIALMLGLVTNGWAQTTPPGILYPPEPTALEPGITPYSPTPTYDYSVPNSCTGCHFILGLDHTSRAVGVQWNDGAQSWQRTGHGWLDSRHAQSNYRSTQNTFCAKCHSPIQASASSTFSNGFVTNATPIPDGRFAAVTCGTCHPPDQVATVLGAQHPNASFGAAIAIYRWKGVDNPASYQTLMPMQEDALCLNCHEERHSTDNSAFAAMYSAGVRCIDCHMAPYRYLGGGSTGLAQLAERYHDWKVAENLPYSCGVAGALTQFRCHTEFDAASAQQFIPFLMQQHSEWWTLPPFNGVVTTPQVAASAHSLSTASDYQSLWQQIQQVQAAQ